MIADGINAAFEIGGAALMWHNVRQLRHDKKIRGVDWRVWGFFAVWGWWNLYYYPSLGQWLSVLAGAVLVAANTTWFVLAIRYRNN